MYAGHCPGRCGGPGGGCQAGGPHAQLRQRGEEQGVQQGSQQQHQSSSRAAAGGGSAAAAEISGTGSGVGLAQTATACSRQRYCTGLVSATRSPHTAAACSSSLLYGRLCLLRSALSSPPPAGLPPAVLYARRGCIVKYWLNAAVSAAAAVVYCAIPSFPAPPRLFCAPNLSRAVTTCYLCWHLPVPPPCHLLTPAPSPPAPNPLTPRTAPTASW
jgi:hypothetical protein